MTLFMSNKSLRDILYLNIYLLLKDHVPIIDSILNYTAPQPGAGQCWERLREEPLSGCCDNPYQKPSWSVNHSGCELVVVVRLFEGTRLTSATQAVPYEVTDSRRMSYSIVKTPTFTVSAS